MSVSTYSTSPQQIMESLLAEGLDPAACHFRIVDDYGSQSIELWSARQESDTELAARLKVEEAQLRDAEKREKAEYKRLAKKYGRKSKG